jgi:hypothetical protein
MKDLETISIDQLQHVGGGRANPFQRLYKWWTGKPGRADRVPPKAIYGEIKPLLKDAGYGAAYLGGAGAAAALGKKAGDALDRMGRHDGSSGSDGGGGGGEE